MDNKEKIKELVNTGDWNEAELKFLKLIVMRKYINKNTEIDDAILRKIAVI